jgi:hypothetical protein
MAVGASRRRLLPRQHSQYTTYLAKHFSEMEGTPRGVEMGHSVHELTAVQHSVVVRGHVSHRARFNYSKINIITW